MLSNAAIYAIRGLIYIASQNDRSTIPISEISEKLNISFHFLTKIFQKFTSKNILSSNRGPKGGISFSRSPEKIYIFEVVDIVDGGGIFDKCVLGLPGCGELEPCPMHDNWARVKDDIKQQFEETTIHDLATKLSARNAIFRV
ncbi:MAG: Rrf2 family transcriptional regulator [Calditrichaeota bacterium]|nr:MAG: Rrf2 family transcriptional regulator [Calditrichota bacterium]MBL1206935.1 Rrf2 family transcriptional regulator [Calditrichota bacterium]NOG46762.1 Rrf2 family transcriptional regulator [Calditrichota bacterium]